MLPLIWLPVAIVIAGSLWLAYQMGKEAGKYEEWMRWTEPTRRDDDDH